MPRNILLEGPDPSHCPPARCPDVNKQVGLTSRLRVSRSSLSLTRVDPVDVEDDQQSTHRHPLIAHASWQTRGGRGGVSCRLILHVFTAHNRALTLSSFYKLSHLTDQADPISRLPYRAGCPSPRSPGDLQPDRPHTTSLWSAVPVSPVSCTRRCCSTPSAAAPDDDEREESL
jgi:hypothetical protein